MSEAGMSEQTEGAEVVLALMPGCTQCGKRFSERACGPTHAIIAADPLRHRLFEPLLAAREAAAEVRGAERALRDLYQSFTDDDFDIEVALMGGEVVRVRILDALDDMRAAAARGVEGGTRVITDLRPESLSLDLEPNAWGYGVAARGVEGGAR